MAYINVPQIFNYVVDSMKDGDIIAIKCEDAQRLNSLRVAFYRQRSLLAKTMPEAANSISISMRTESCSIVIGKNSVSAQVTLISKDCSTIRELTQEDLKTTESVEERQRRLMKADGATPEEIELYFQEKEEKNDKENKDKETSV